MLGVQVCALLLLQGVFSIPAAACCGWVLPAKPGMLLRGAGGLY